MSQSIEQSILVCLRESPQDLSIEEIAAKTGIHRNTVSKYMFGLEKEGKVRISRIVGNAKMYVVAHVGGEKPGMDYPPRIMPECKRLQDIVITGLVSSVFEPRKKEAARAALKRLRTNMCAESLTYIIQYANRDLNIFDTFAKEIIDTATEYLNELS